MGYKDLMKVSSNMRFFFNFRRATVEAIVSRLHPASPETVTIPNSLEYIE